MKAKIVSKNVIDIIDYDAKIKALKKEFDLYLIQNSIEDETINAILKKKDKNRTESDLIKIVLRKEAEDAYKKSVEEYYEYKNFESVEYSGEAAGVLDKLEPYYEEDDTTVYQKFKLVKNDKFLVSEEINRLKKELSDTDYQVMKCYEASLTKIELPYDIDSLTKLRQTLRDEINRLESLIK